VVLRGSGVYRLFEHAAAVDEAADGSAPVIIVRKPDSAQTRLLHQRTLAEVGRSFDGSVCHFASDVIA